MTSENRFSSQEINEIYTYWRIHLMVAMYIGYGVFYFTRKSLSFTMPIMEEELELSTADFGTLGTLFYITYGISKFLSGIVSDQSKPSYFMGLGLIATGIINILFGFSSSLATFSILWVLNAIFQGWGWPPCAKILTHWYSRSERGFWWSIWNTCHSLSGVIIPISIAVIVVNWGWRSGFIAIGIFAITVGAILCFRLKDKPISLGLPSVGDWRNDELERQQEREGQHLKFTKIISTYVIFNKYIWLLCGSYLLVYVVRIAINDWGNLYLIKRHEYELITANTVVSMFEVGGIFGSLLGGWGSDRFFQGNRAPMILIFSLGIFVSVAALWLTPLNNIWVLSGCLFTVGFFVFGPQLLIGMSAAECSHKDAAGTATGFVGLFGYLGAALSGYPLAVVIESFSWEGFFAVITLCSASIGLLILPFLNVQQRAGTADT